ATSWNGRFTRRRAPWSTTTRKRGRRRPSRRGRSKKSASVNSKLFVKIWFALREEAVYAAHHLSLLYPTRPRATRSHDGCAKGNGFPGFSRRHFPANLHAFLAQGKVHVSRSPGVASTKRKHFRLGGRGM